MAIMSSAIRENHQIEMVHDMDQSGPDASTLHIPDGMLGISEVYAQYTGADDEPAEDRDSEAELDENLFDNFQYEMDPHSGSACDHELFDDDGLPLIDVDNSPLIPWQDGI